MGRKDALSAAGRDFADNIILMPPGTSLRAWLFCKRGCLLRRNARTCTTALFRVSRLSRICAICTLLYGL